MTPLGEFLKKWWLPVAALLLASSPTVGVLWFRKFLEPYVASQDPMVVLNIGALLLWLILLLAAFLFLQRPWLQWDEPTGTWVSCFTQLRYCAKCRATKVITPLKNEVTGWRCMNCQSFFYDPARSHIESPKKRAAKSDRV